jgi:hypothetical protein
MAHRNAGPNNRLDRSLQVVTKVDTRIVPFATLFKDNFDHTYGNIVGEISPAEYMWSVITNCAYMVIESGRPFWIGCNALAPWAFS